MIFSCSLVGNLSEELKIIRAWMLNNLLIKNIAAKIDWQCILWKSRVIGNPCQFPVLKQVFVSRAINGSQK